MKARFESEADLINALRRQEIVCGDGDAATAFAKKGALVEFGCGERLIEQGAEDRDVYFILAGKVRIVVNKVSLYYRRAGDSVGEMSAINPATARAASVEADELTVALKLGAEEFERVCRAHPDLWRNIAVQLSTRLEQRNRFVNRANIRARVFLISSTEALPVGRQLKIGLGAEADVFLWNDEDIFGAGSYPLEVLEREVALADFGVAIAQPDDLVFARDRWALAPNDNVVFELGFFMSQLTRHRTILLVPNSDVKLPSDFKGLIPLSYEWDEDPVRRAELFAPTVSRMLLRIQNLGVRASLMEVR